MNRKKYLILLKYIVDSYLKTFIFTVPFAAVLFVILKVSGMYDRLDLKFDSPVLTLPLITALALSFIVFIFGSILYVYKYRRTAQKTAFYRAAAEAVDSQLRNDGRKGENR